SYTLVIDRDWLDAAGNPLKDTYRKKFRVLSPDDQPPDPKTWKIRPTEAGTRKALEVTFPKPMEHALLERALWVTDTKGKRLAGEITTRDAETVWQFVPKQPWEAGAHQLVIDTTLEDLAGNSIGRPFEVDILHAVERHVATKTVTLP